MCLTFGNNKQATFTHPMKKIQKYINLECNLSLPMWWLSHIFSSKTVNFFPFPDEMIPKHWATEPSESYSMTNF